MTAAAHPPLPEIDCLRRETAGSVMVRLHVVPNAARTQIDGLHDGALKVRLHAPPVDGKANDALVRWLATTLAIGRTDIELVRGQTSRRKEVRIRAGAADTARWSALKS
jgi:uncharacterized protein